MSDLKLNHIVGGNIKLFREQMGLTQETLALYLETSREKISYYETGSRPVSSIHLIKLANLFCINEYEFYEEELQNQKVNLAFAFRADSINSNDLESIAQFKKIVRNYLNMKKVVANG